MSHYGDFKFLYNLTILLASVICSLFSVFS